MAVCVGCGFEVVDGILQHKLDPAGHMTCGAAGLAVSIPGILDPISPDACNGISRRGNGLYSNCPDTITGAVNNTDAIAPVTVSTGGAGTFDWPQDVVTVNNTLCCDVGGRISTRAGGIRLLTHTGFYCEANLDININGGGWGAAAPDTAIVFENQTGSDVHTALNGFLDENFLAISAGGSVTYQGRIHLHVLAGTADATGEIGVEINWVLPQINCC